MERRLSRRALLRGAAGTGLVVAGSQVGHGRRASAAAPPVVGSPLKPLADRLGFNLGVLMGFDSPGLAEIYARDFNLANVYSSSWGFGEPKRGQRDFGTVDWELSRASRFAPKPFIYGLIDPLGWDTPFGLPNWLPDLSRSEMIDAMTRWVGDAITHLSGKVSAVSVVGEVNSSPGWDHLYDVIGLDYVEIAFRAARKADPTVKLCYYDYQNHAKPLPRYAITKQISDNLKFKGLIDLVGCEGQFWPLWKFSKRDYIDC
jgi:endo-1,4-beta-xylanase